MSGNYTENIYLSIDHDMIPAFFSFLEKGVKKEIFVDNSIQQLLCEQLSISMDYIDTRVKTLFLNNNPVGDIYATIVNDGATLALSAAMPGLAGATFRRMESTESSETLDKKEEAEQKKGIILLKFFNMILKELGPTLLESGVLIAKYELAKFFAAQSEDFIKACKIFKINDQKSTIEMFCKANLQENDELINLYVNSL